MMDKPTTSLLHYTGLMEKMAEAMGIDVADAQDKGLLDEQLIHRLKTRCALCEKPNTCQRLLKNDTADLPPEFCVNRQYLSSLSESLSEPE
jgi:Family of unknown function (DUF6455)